MKTNIVWFFILCCASAAIVSGCGRAEEERDSEDAVVPVEVYSARAGAFTEAISYVGDVRGRKQVDVFPKVDGKILRFEAREGDEIGRDGLIALIDRDVTGHDFAPFPLESPIDGVVVKTYGDTGDSVSPQSVIAVVADVEEVIVRISVSEMDYASVRPGQRASVSADAYPGREFSGVVTRISRLIDPMTRTAEAEISIENPGMALIPGMFARIELVVGERDALLVHRDGVVRRPGTGSHYSFVVEDGIARRVRVRRGAASGDYIEILDGLEEGDRVVVSGHGALETGISVRIAGEAR